MRASVILVLFVAACRSAAPAAAKDAPPPSVTLKTPAGTTHEVRVELALTPEEQQRGLMFREQLPSGDGMLFVFEDDRVRTFWMKNTLIPLDMIFIARGGRVVGVVHEAVPRTEDPRRVLEKSRYVLEVPGGWARAKGIGPGTTVRFENVPGVPAGKP